MINSTPVTLLRSRALRSEDSGQTLLYFGATDIELLVSKVLPRGFGCEVVQLGEGFVRFVKAPDEDVELRSSLLDGSVGTSGKNTGVDLWFLANGSYATRVIGAIDSGGGSVGPAGPQGEPGVAGPPGPQGDPGPTGPAGADGVGTQGPEGPAGPAGAASTVPGPVGPEGPQGAKGDTGVDGPPGVQGLQGATGPTGAAGAPGAKGDPGVQGATGPQGPTMVSADVGNLAKLGTDGLLHVPNTSKLMGVTDGTEAAQGTIGEYKVVANQVGVTLPSTVPTQICPLPLEPGDWEIWGSVDFAPAAGVSPNMVAASVSVHPDSLPTEDDLLTGVGILNMITTNALTSGQRQMLMTGQCRSNSAAPLTVYLVAQTTLGGAGLLTAKGYICARRAR